MTKETPADEPAAAAPDLIGLIGALLAYVGARLLLVALVTAAIMGIGSLVNQTVPLIVAVAFGFVIAFPIGMVLFKSLRTNVNTRIAEYDEARARRRDDLQGRLRGSGK
ncbi:MAG: DUF4229 domain-containing protein [Gordonia sp. (in: high G+C Gram-positive bacteria)]|uniref:DUF4229 domain-containing protein n=1 Tax=Gordonia sp. (in: high G+C Gram-positive bacteria) TaxID=84139 RepID=UPI0039E499A7